LYKKVHKSFLRIPYDKELIKQESLECTQIKART
jgi:hypothetical protein